MNNRCVETIDVETQSDPSCCQGKKTPRASVKFTENVCDICKKYPCVCGKVPTKACKVCRKVPCTCLKNERHAKKKASKSKEASYVCDTGPCRSVHPYCTYCKRHPCDCAATKVSHLKVYEPPKCSAIASFCSICNHRSKSCPPVSKQTLAGRKPCVIPCPPSDALFRPGNPSTPNPASYCPPNTPASDCATNGSPSHCRPNPPLSSPPSRPARCSPKSYQTTAPPSPKLGCSTENPTRRAARSLKPRSCPPCKNYCCCRMEHPCTDRSCPVKVLNRAPWRSKDYGDCMSKDLFDTQQCDLCKSKMRHMKCICGKTKSSVVTISPYMMKRVAVSLKPCCCKPSCVKSKRCKDFPFIPPNATECTKTSRKVVPSRRKSKKPEKRKKKQVQNKKNQVQNEGKKVLSSTSICIAGELSGMSCDRPIICLKTSSLPECFPARDPKTRENSHRSCIQAQSRTSTRSISFFDEVNVYQPKRKSSGNSSPETCHYSLTSLVSVESTPAHGRVSSGQLIPVPMSSCFSESSFHVCLSGSPSFHGCPSTPGSILSPVISLSSYSLPSPPNGSPCSSFIMSLPPRSGTQHISNSLCHLGLVGSDIDVRMTCVPLGQKNEPKMIKKCQMQVVFDTHSRHNKRSVLCAHCGMDVKDCCCL